MRYNCPFPFSAREYSCKYCPSYMAADCRSPENPAEIAVCFFNPYIVSIL